MDSLDGVAMGYGPAVYAEWQKYSEGIVREPMGINQTYELLRVIERIAYRMTRIGQAMEGL
jgi:hypothetical protein